MTKLNCAAGVLVLSLVGLSALKAETAVSSPSLKLVPQPRTLTTASDKPDFKLSKQIQVSLPPNQPLIDGHLHVFAEALQQLGNYQCHFSSPVAGDATPLTVQIDPTYPPEAYRLVIKDQRILIQAAAVQGTAHATATLLQLLGQVEQRLPQLEIRDSPACPYRSFMVDLGRNPHSLDALKETVDLLWYYKIESFHLHLTDDQRFAFPSRAFPKLVTQQNKITWEEFQELAQYAEVRGVTIIPELEVPGHSRILRNQYPEVFGKTSTNVAQLPTARKAIKVLLDEIIAVFPASPSIHIGGDEAFGVPEELQRDLINDLHAYLKSRGKQTIVWEGPSLGRGDNKVHQDVVHINWRTINFPADQMLSAGYRVVNAAWDPLYVVDHYPRNNFTMASPEYIYHNLALRRFKHFNPRIRTYADPIQVPPTDQLLGFCMPWWEGREANYFPLITPRLIPLAAIAWNKKHEQDYINFATRSQTCEAARQRSFYPVSISAAPLALADEGVFHRQTTVTLSSRLVNEIRYTLDGQAPTLKSPRYHKPLLLNKTTLLRAATFVQSKQVGHGSRKTFVHVSPTQNLALGKPVTTSVTSGPLFSAARLTDGGTGNLDYFLGYPSEPKPIRITIDLKQVQPVDRIVTHAFFNNRTFESYSVHLSRDGKIYEQIASRLTKPAQLTARAEHDFPVTQARYVRIVTHGCKNYVFDSFSRLTEIQVFSSQPRRDTVGAAD